MDWIAISLVNILLFLNNKKTKKRYSCFARNSIRISHNISPTLKGIHPKKNLNLVAIEG